MTAPRRSSDQERCDVWRAGPPAPAPGRWSLRLHVVARNLDRTWADQPETYVPGCRLGGGARRRGWALLCSPRASCNVANIQGVVDNPPVQEPMRRVPGGSRCAPATPMAVASRSSASPLVLAAMVVNMLWFQP